MQNNLQNTGNSAIKNGLDAVRKHWPTHHNEKEPRMADKALNILPELRQPSAFAETLANLENRETPDWDEVWAGYEQYLDERGELS